MTKNNSRIIRSTYKVTCNKCDLSKTYDSETDARNARRAHESANAGHAVKITTRTSG